MNLKGFIIYPQFYSFSLDIIFNILFIKDFILSAIKFKQSIGNT